MRNRVRGLGIVTALAAAAMLAACQPPAPSGEEANAPPTNAEREAQLAAEQLAALGGAADAATRALYEGDFQASGGIGALGGEEGAWELSLLSDYAQFSRPGLGDDGALTGERDYRANGMRVVAGPLTITVMQQECQISSGAALPYVAHVLFEGVAYQGCARRGVNAGERATWASVLPELIPAIDACLGRVSARPARITFASAMDEGVVAVRIRESDGSRRECIADASGAAVQVYEPISDEDRRAGEGEIEFQRGATQPRAQAGRTVEQAMGRDGASLGWLIKRG
ncbi:hypothetical protein U91I_04095 [alpha proteobacterium U9-1i]|nr:hypothetical protein U91I_04095 [alpha proteobacterium U9-1i]